MGKPSRVKIQDSRLHSRESLQALEQDMTLLVKPGTQAAWALHGQQNSLTAKPLNFLECQFFYIQNKDSDNTQTPGSL